LIIFIRWSWLCFCSPNIRGIVFLYFPPIVFGNIGEKIFLMFVRIVFCSKSSINIIWSVLQEKMMTKTFYFTFFWIFTNKCCLKVPQYTICNDFEFYTTHIYMYMAVLSIDIPFSMILQPSDTQNSSFWWYQVWFWEFQGTRIAKNRKLTPTGAHFQKFPYPIKKTVTNMFLVVADHIFHTNYRKNCLEFFLQPQHVPPRGQSWTGQV